MKYKVGDYIAAPNLIFSRVEVVIDSGLPLYGLNARKMSKSSHISWQTEYELDKQGYEAQTPDFELWSTIAEGDTIRIRGTNDNPEQYMVVLARIGNLVMISDVPTTSSERDMIDRLSDQLEELSEGRIERQKIKEALKPVTKTRSEAFKTAHGDWHTTEELALMNWELLRE